MLYPSKLLVFSEAIKASIDEPIHPNSCGRIKCQGVYYRAEFYKNNFQNSVYPEESVLVVALRGNVALIKPEISTKS